MRVFLTVFLILISSKIVVVDAQNSVARQWNDELLEAIRNDFARPTIHARNLFHSSILMYDAWALFNDNAETLFLGKTFGTYSCDFNGISSPADSNEAIHQVISFAIYRLLVHRFADSPNAENTLESLTNLF